MQLQDLAHSAVQTTLSVVSVPLRWTFAVARRVTGGEEEQQQEPAKATKPSTARPRKPKRAPAPAKPASAVGSTAPAAERAEVVAEQTDGVREAAERS